MEFVVDRLFTLLGWLLGIFLVLVFTVAAGYIVVYGVIWHLLGL